MVSNTVVGIPGAASAIGLGRFLFFVGEGQLAAIGVAQRRSLKPPPPDAQFARCNRSPVGRTATWPITPFQKNLAGMQSLSASLGIFLGISFEDTPVEPLHRMAEINLSHIIHGTRTAASVDMVTAGAMRSTLPCQR